MIKLSLIVIKIQAADTRSFPYTTFYCTIKNDLEKMQMIRLIQDTIIECAIKPFAGGGGGGGEYHRNCNNGQWSQKKNMLHLF